MGIFATRGRRPTDGPGARAGLPEAQRQALPQRFEAVGEALASGSGSIEACAVLGADLARQGMPLEEALDGLASTCLTVTGRSPEHTVTRALAVAWADATLAWLHQLSCEDPLTGLASPAHVRGRVGDVYRGEVHHGVPARDSHALLLLEAPRGPHWRPGDAVDDLATALLVAGLGATVRSVFADSDTVGRLGPGRVVVLVRRDRLGPRLAALREVLGDGGPPVRLWVEGLPGTDVAAGQLLDELARG